MNGSESSRHGTRDYREDRRDRERHRERRRSRSPPHRGGRQYEVDSYSSSRDYRDRDGGDRYSGGGGGGGGGSGSGGAAGGGGGGGSGGRRDRHDDRGFDRRGGGGGRRDDRDQRRGGGGQRDREREREREREKEREKERRSASPATRRRRDATPDLTNVVSVLDRKRRMTQWDIKPPGYESITAEQAKLSGMFPLPGAPRTQPIDPAKIVIPQNTGDVASTSALNLDAARQSKRIFVHGLPDSSTDESVMEFFNFQLNGLNVISSTDACRSATVSKENHFALVEFREAEDATVALALDGIDMDDPSMNGDTSGASKQLKIARPSDYIAPSPSLASEYHGQRLGMTKDSIGKVIVAGIPPYISEEQILELLSTMGSIKAFVLAKDVGTDQSRGFAFVEYVDPALTDVAIEGLNGMQLGDSALRLLKACIGTKQTSGLEAGVSAMSVLAGSESKDLSSSRVLQLLNMVTAEDLMDNQEYEEIKEDIGEECSKYGQVLEIKIPRPAGARQNPGVGKVFVKFKTIESAQAAMKSLAGRKFADRTVVTTFFGEQYFDVNAW